MSVPPPSPDAPPPRLTVVAPVHNEGRVLVELGRRCVGAARATGLPFEVILVDDGSTDDTRALAATFAEQVDPAATFLHLSPNRGQLGATRAGLAAARGEIVVVLDGDLQDPPEVLTALVTSLLAQPDLDVVFACKTTRDDPWWFRLGRWGYAKVAALPGARSVPAGAGAFLALRAPVARAVAAAPVHDANLAPLVIALGVRAGTHPYEKVARYDGQSRVGLAGLVKEAVGSWMLTGALPALLGWAALAVLLVAGGVRAVGLPGRLAWVLVAVATALLTAAGLTAWRARRVLAQLPRPPRGAALHRSPP